MSVQSKALAGLPREIRSDARKLIAQGWELLPGAHPRLRCANGVVTLSCSPSDWRHHRNFRAKVRRLGGVI